MAVGRGAERAVAAAELSLAGYQWKKIGTKKAGRLETARLSVRD